MMPGMPERRTHDYVRHGTTSLVRGNQHRRRHGDLQPAPTPPRHWSSRSSSPRSTRRSPTGLEIHLICDNYGTHKHPSVNKWLAAHPRFRCTSPRRTPPGSTRSNASSPTSPPTCSSEVTTAASKPSRPTSANGSKAWNDNPKPFIWTKTAEEILASLGRLLQRIRNSRH